MGALQINIEEQICILPLKSRGLPVQIKESMVIFQREHKQSCPGI